MYLNNEHQYKYMSRNFVYTIRVDNINSSKYRKYSVM